MLSSGDIQIRRFDPSDAERLALVYLDSARHHASIDPERYIVPPLDDVMARYLGGGQHPPDAYSLTLVAEHGSEIVGFVDGWLQRPTDLMHRPVTICFIAEIGVSESARSQGIGALLMQAMEAWGRTNGAEYTLLEYNAHNARARRFYEERMGYRSGSTVAIKRL